MLDAKKKVTKKQMKEDKLVTSYYKVQSFYFENQAKVLIAAGVVVLIIVAVIMLNKRGDTNNVAASAALAKVTPLIEAGSLNEAIEGDKTGNIDGLKKIVNEYGGSEAGEVARIYLANAYFILGKVDEALDQFEDYSGSNELLKAASKAGAASCYESKNEWEKAANLYLDAANISKINPSNPEFLLKAGKCFIKLDNKSRAKELFLSIKKDYPTSPITFELDKYLLQIEN
ncbi:MAG: tetratricopeptide repeat protein [Melioribacteraceae bacterium]|nr:tetratricopeptide repeat protein [Melioribacteraceae bacterium]